MCEYIYLFSCFCLFFRMEETVRTLLQYKSKFEQLKQDRHSVANSYEVSELYTLLCYKIIARCSEIYFLFISPDAIHCTNTYCSNIILSHLVDVCGKIFVRTMDF